MYQASNSLMYIWLYNLGHNGLVFFYWHELILIAAWVSNYNLYKMWIKITYPIKMNYAAAQVWEWKRNFIPHFTEYVITYTCCDWNKSTMGLAKVAHESQYPIDDIDLRNNGQTDTLIEIPQSMNPLGAFFVISWNSVGIDWNQFCHLGSCMRTSPQLTNIDAACGNRYKNHQTDLLWVSDQNISAPGYWRSLSI